LHLLDIAENSVAAGAKTIEIMVEEDLANDRLKISVQDDGRGMDEALLAQVSDPFVTSRTTRKVGLGIPLFKAAAEACNGHLSMTSALGKGHAWKLSFKEATLTGCLWEIWRVRCSPSSSPFQRSIGCFIIEPMA
jgi:signal transduction histidine kinase